MRCGQGRGIPRRTGTANSLLESDGDGPVRRPAGDPGIEFSSLASGQTGAVASTMAA